MPDFHYPNMKRFPGFQLATTERKKEEALVIYMALEGIKPCIKSALMAHISLSVQRGGPYCELRSGFFGFILKYRHHCVNTRVSACHLTAVIIVRTVRRLDELIPL